MQRLDLELIDDLLCQPLWGSNRLFSSTLDKRGVEHSPGIVLNPHSNNT